jgi:adenine-specific DNA glycosylase
MMPLPRAVIRLAKIADPVFTAVPIQAGLGGCPWRVAVASMLLCRTRRPQMEGPLQELLTRWPDAAHLARADYRAVEDVVRPCGFATNRARQLGRFSSLYLGDSWEDLRELPGVGKYVADAVGLFCFACIDLESDDRVLRAYAEKLHDDARNG